jgi:Zn-dependent peptidase ImmA (M78 family)
LSFTYKRFTRRELEAIAAAFLKTRGKFCGCRVLIEEMLEAEGYDIFPVQGLKKYAEAYLPKRPNIVFVDEDQQLSRPLRYRFTIAEELAHILVARKIFNRMGRSEVEKVFQQMDDSDYADFERNAKYLAACLLMPRPDFVERFSLHRQRFSATIVNPSEIAARVILSLASDFDVSKEPTAYRARHLGLVTEECLLGMGLQ